MPQYTLVPEQLPANSGVQAAPPTTTTVRRRPPSQHSFIPYTVPSNTDAQSGTVRWTHENQQYASQRHPQHTIYPLHNAHQQASGSSPTRVVAAPQASSPFTTHVQQSSQTSPSSQIPPFQVYTFVNNLSPVQAQTPQTPQTAAVASDQALRSQVVSLLASTANGCIAELGYADLPKENHRLQTEYTKLTEKCNALQEENNNLRRALAKKPNTSKYEQRDREKSQLIQTLNERIATLENDAEVLRSQCRVLQQARSLDYPQEYRKLESKYRYALQFLQKHQTWLPDQQRQETTRATVSPTTHADHAGTIIDLTVSRDHSPVGAAVQRAATPVGAPNPAPVPPQGMQTNSVLSPVSSNNSPPIISQRSTSVPQIPKHARTASVPSPVVPCSSAPPTVQVFPTSIPSMSGPADVARPSSAPNNSRRVPIPSQILRSQTVAPTDTTVPIVVHDLRMQQHLNQFTAFAPSTQQATSSGPRPYPEAKNDNAVHSEEGSPQLQIQTAFERPIQRTPPTPISAAQLKKSDESAGISSPRRISHVHAAHEITAATESGTGSLREIGPESKSQAQTPMQTETQRLSPSLAPGASAISSAEDVERMEVDVEEKPGVQEVPVLQELKVDIQHGREQGDGQGDGHGLDQDVVMSESEIQTHGETVNKIENKNEDKNGHENGNQIEKENGTENKDANEKNNNDSESTVGVGIKQVPNISIPNCDDPTGDNSVPERASVHATQQAAEQQDGRERREGQDGQDTVQRNDDKINGEGEGEEEEEEEEEENWGDLTDDEHSTSMKQPVFDCISSIFYDDENDERLCNFCNARLESKNLPDPRPTFTDCSMRDLIVHAKNEHPFVWEKLRRPQGDS